MKKKTKKVKLKGWVVERHGFYAFFPTKKDGMHAHRDWFQEGDHIKRSTLVMYR